MTPAGELAQTIAKVLETFASSNRPSSIDDVAKDCGTQAACVRSALIVLRPFGLLPEVDGMIPPPSEVGRAALRSVARMVRENIVLINDWTGLTAECTTAEDVLQRGSRFLWTIERRRLSRDDKEPINEEEIARAVIKAESSDGSQYVLMFFGKHSQRFQLVGGHVEKGERPLDAVKREIDEEVRPAAPQLTYQLSVPPVELDFVYQSTRTGAVTKFHVHHFIPTFVKGLPSKLPSDTLRWVGIDEFRKGVTRDTKYRILPEPQDAEPLFDLLRKTPVNFHATLDFSDTGKIVHGPQAIRPPTFANAIAGALAVFVAVVITIGVAASFVPAWAMAIIASFLTIVFVFVLTAIGVVTGDTFGSFSKWVLKWAFK